MKCARFITVVAALAVVSASASALAQSYLDGSAKARGDYGQASASRAMSSARGYAQDFSRYVQAAPKVDREVAMDTADAIGDYIPKAKKHFAWMRANAVKANDKATLTSLDEIDKNLAAAEKAHQGMMEMCKKDNVDPAECTKCCHQIDDSLAKAIDEHDKLMKKLGMPMPTATKK
jgi:Zn ribbon nucleic-acid-binding protein